MLELSKESLMKKGGGRGAQWVSISPTIAKDGSSPTLVGLCAVGFLLATFVLKAPALARRKRHRLTWKGGSTASLLSPELVVETKKGFEQ